MNVVLLLNTTFYNLSWWRCSSLQGLGASSSESSPPGATFFCGWKVCLLLFALSIPLGSLTDVGDVLLKGMGHRTPRTLTRVKRPCSQLLIRLIRLGTVLSLCSSVLGLLYSLRLKSWS